MGGIHAPRTVLARPVGSVLDVFVADLRGTGTRARPWALVLGVVADAVVRPPISALFVVDVDDTVAIDVQRSCAVLFEDIVN